MSKFAPPDPAKKGKLAAALKRNMARRKQAGSESSEEIPHGIPAESGQA